MQNTYGSLDNILERMATLVAELRSNKISQMIIELLYKRRNGAKLMEILHRATIQNAPDLTLDNWLLNWELVRGTGDFAKIAAREEDGSLSVTITKPQSEFRSPLRIEVELVDRDAGLTTNKKIDITLDPGDFSGMQAEVWRKAIEFFPALHQIAAKNTLTREFSERLAAKSN